MGHSSFVNRDAEFDDLGARLARESENPLALFLVAPSGIGKSRFMDEAAKRFPDPKMVRVRIRRSRGARYENGYFLLQTASALHNVAQTVDELPTLTEFNRNLSDYLDIEDIGLEAADDLMEDLDLPLINQIKKLIERQLSIGRFKPKKLLGPNEAAGVAYLKIYVRTILQKMPIALILENAHLLDEDTLGFFSETINWPDRALLIAEFTTLQNPIENTQAWALGELAEEFERAGFDISTMALTPLEYDHYCEVAKNKGVAKSDMLRQSYSSEGGNLRAIYDVSTIERNEPGKPLDGSSARIALDTLPRDQRFLTVAIAVHDEAVPKTSLEAFHVAMEARGSRAGATREAFVQLVAGDILEDDGDTVSLAHDSLAAAITDSTDQALQALARTVWTEIFLSMSADETDWRRLLHLLVEQGDAARLDHALEQYLEHARLAHYKDELIELLIDAAEDFSERARSQPSKLFNRVLARISQILYELEEYEAVQQVTPFLQLPGERAKLLETTLLDRLDKPRDASEIALGELETGALQVEDEMTWSLIAIASLAAIDRRPDGLKIYRDVVAKPGAMRSPLFPFLLRLTDIFLGIEESLEPIKRSAQAFEQLGNAIETAHSKNSLGMQLARLGRLDEASALLAEADETLSGSSVDQAQILNNRACVRLFQGRYDETTRLYLTLARDLVRRPFDQVVVALNVALLDALSGADNTEQSFETAARLINLHQLPTQGLARAHFWNKHHWATLTGETDLSERSLEEVRKLDTKPNSIWDARLNGAKLADPEYEFLASLPYHVSFLSKWHFPIDLISLDT